MSDAARDQKSKSGIEHMLKRAFAPIDPPVRLHGRIESRMERVTFAAAEELADWELRAMRDPRNWVKPAVAVIAGASAGTALLVLRARSKRGGEGHEALDALSEAFGDAARELGRSATGRPRSQAERDNRGNSSPREQ